MKTQLPFAAIAPFAAKRFRNITYLAVRLEPFTPPPSWIALPLHFRIGMIRGAAEKMKT